MEYVTLCLGSIPKGTSSLMVVAFSRGTALGGSVPPRRIGSSCDVEWGGRALLCLFESLNFGSRKPWSEALWKDTAFRDDCINDREMVLSQVRHSSA